MQLLTSELDGLRYAEYRSGMATALGRRIADEVRNYLAQQEITQQELADRLGKRQYWVSRRLTHQAAIHADELVVIATALGQPVSRFIPDNVDVAEPVGRKRRTQRAAA